MPYGVQIDTPLSVNAIFFWINIRVYSVRNIYRVVCVLRTNRQNTSLLFLNLYSTTAKKETTKPNPVKAAILLL